MKDLDTSALSMPGTTRRTTDDGRPPYFVNDKLYCCHRTQRRDALDEAGQMLDDVLMFRVADLDTKEALLADTASPFFTTPHFDGYAAILLRIVSLRRIDRTELFELVADAWLTRAPKRVATSWLATIDAQGRTGSV